MTAPKSRWLAWQPSNEASERRVGADTVTPQPPGNHTDKTDKRCPPEPNTSKKHTDKTDKSPSVSFVSSFSGHIAADEDRSAGAWDAADWRDHYEERAAIVEHDGEMSRQDAERLALDDTINQWLVMHPPPATDDSGGCVHCGADLGNDGVPVLAGSGHTWLHSRCHHDWLAERRRQAAEALRAMGIEATEWTA